MNKTELNKFLATGEKAAEDAAPRNGRRWLNLAAHDKRFHKNGYRQGDKCKFREQMAENDDVDLLYDAQNEEAEDAKRIEEVERKWKNMGNAPVVDTDDGPIYFQFNPDKCEIEFGGATNTGMLVEGSKSYDLDLSLDENLQEAEELALSASTGGASDDDSENPVRKYLDAVGYGETPPPTDAAHDFKFYDLGEGIDRFGKYFKAHPENLTKDMIGMVDSMSTSGKQYNGKFWYSTDVVPFFEKNADKLDEGQRKAVADLRLVNDIAYSTGWDLKDPWAFSANQMADFRAVFAGEKAKVDGMPDYVTTPEIAKAMIVAKLEDANYHAYVAALRKNNLAEYDRLVASEYSA